MALLFAPGKVQLYSMHENLQIRVVATVTCGSAGVDFRQLAFCPAGRYLAVLAGDAAMQLVFIISTRTGKALCFKRLRRGHNPHEHISWCQGAEAGLSLYVWVPGFGGASIGTNNWVPHFADDHANVRMQRLAVTIGNWTARCCPEAALCSVLGGRSTAKEYKRTGHACQALT